MRAHIHCRYITVKDGMCLYTCIHMYVYTYIHVYVCMHACMHVYMHISRLSIGDNLVYRELSEVFVLVRFSFFFPEGAD